MRFQNLLKQLIFPITLLLLCTAILISAPVRGVLFPQRLKASDQLKDFYNEKNPNAIVKTDLLYDSGYDFQIFGKTVGRYYYSLQDGCCQFYLLDKKLADNDSGIINGLTIFGIMRKLEEKEYENLMIQMAEDLDWSSSKLSAMTSPYVVSGLAFVNWVHTVLLAALLVCFVYAAGDLIVVVIRYQKAKSYLLKF